MNPRIVPAYPRSSTTVALQALGSSLQSGMEHAIKVPSPKTTSQYVLVEARLRSTDDFEKGIPGYLFSTSSGIPSEGVVVYWIDESSWPPVHLSTPIALHVGQSHTDPNSRIKVTVKSQISLGFEVAVTVDPAPECQRIVSRIAELDDELAEWAERLHEAGDKASIRQAMRPLEKERGDLVAEAALLRCY